MINDLKKDMNKFLKDHKKNKWKYKQLNEIMKTISDMMVEFGKGMELLKKTQNDIKLE